MLSKGGLSWPPLSIDLSKLVPLVFVSWKRTAYLPPNYSRNIVVARVGSTAKTFMASPNNGGGTLSKACLRSREAMSILQLCAVDDRFLRTVDISFALRPSIHPSGLPMLLTQSTSSARCGCSARHPQLSQCALCADASGPTPEMRDGPWLGCTHLHGRGLRFSAAILFTPTAFFIKNVERHC